MQNIINFRDFGGQLTRDGKRVKTGQLYRSGHLDRASPHDLAALQALGIRAVFDLRSAKERKRAPPLWPGAQYVTLPMRFDELTRQGVMPLLFQRNAEDAVAAMIAGVYRDTVDHAGPQLAEMFRRLCQPTTYPVLIFCRAGRDRTGFVSAVILLALGVSAADVTQDYLRSNAYHLPQARRTLTALKLATLGLFPTHTLRAVFTSRVQYIHTVIQRIEDQYGGIVHYLAQCSIPQGELTMVRRLLLQSDE